LSELLPVSTKTGNILEVIYL